MGEFQPAAKIYLMPASRAALRGSRRNLAVSSDSIRLFQPASEPIRKGERHTCELVCNWREPRRSGMTWKGLLMMEGPFAVSRNTKTGGGFSSGRAADVGMTKTT